jgi:hypothetical protein
VRVLLDENLPHDLAKVLTGHAVSTVQGFGSAGTKNGALLKRAGGQCDVFVTMDGNIEHQHSVSDLSFRIVVIDSASNRMADLLPVAAELLSAIDAVRPGEVRRVGTFPKGRGRSKMGGEFVGVISQRPSRSQASEQHVDLVVAHDLNHPPGREILVAAVESVPEAPTLHRGDLVAGLHEAQGVGDDVGFSRVAILLDLAPDECLSILRHHDVHGSASAAPLVQ